MLIIGLAGGIASGKSFVAGCFEQLGAALIDADRVGHEVLAQSSICLLYTSPSPRDQRGSRMPSSA